MIPFPSDPPSPLSLLLSPSACDTGTLAVPVRFAGPPDPALHSGRADYAIALQTNLVQKMHRGVIEDAVIAWMLVQHPGLGGKGLWGASL